MPVDILSFAGTVLLVWVAIACVSFLVYCWLESIANSPGWKTFLVGVKREVARQKMVEARTQAAKEMEAARRKAEARFRSYANDVVRHKQTTRSR